MPKLRLGAGCGRVSSRSAEAWLWGIGNYLGFWLTEYEVREDYLDYLQSIDREAAKGLQCVFSAIFTVRSSYSISILYVQ